MLQIQDFSLRHVGSLELANCRVFSCVDESEPGSSSGRAVLDRMLPIVYRTRSDPAHKTKTSSWEQPLFSIAMEMKLDKERNSTVGYFHDI